MLLSGANPNARTDFHGNAPALCIAAKEGFVDVVSLLCEFGADATMTGDDGLFPLAYAAQQGHIEVIRLLVSKRAKVRNV